LPCLSRQQHSSSRQAGAELRDAQHARSARRLHGALGLDLAGAAALRLHGSAGHDTQGFCRAAPARHGRVSDLEACCRAGVKNLLEDEAVVVGGSNHSHATADLYDAIAAGDYPEWKLLIQARDARAAGPAAACFWRGVLVGRLVHEARSNSGGRYVFALL